MSVSEFVLLKRFASSGDAEAFAEIIREHAPLVYGVCMRILSDKDMAADVVQDTFIQLVRNANSITDSLPNWLHRVAKNKAIELIRQNTSRKEREKIFTLNTHNKQSQKDAATWQEISSYIDEELDDLDDQTREILILHFFEGKTMTYIAEKCGISQPTVSRRIESGIELLRLKLKSRGIIVPAAVFMTLLSDNIIKAAPASIMKELGKIAIAGSKAAIGAKIASSISAGIAVKTKIIAGMLIVLLGAGLTVVFSFIANGEDKPASPWELVSSSLGKVSLSDPNRNITVSELLDKWAETQNKLKSFTAKAQASREARSALVGNGIPIKYQTLSDCRYDGERFSYRYKLWGKPNDTLDIPEDKPNYESRLLVDKSFYQYGKVNNTGVTQKRFPSGSVVLDKSEKHNTEREKGILDTFNAAPLMGYLPNDAERVDAVIRRADSTLVQAKMDKIGGSDCYVIEASTKQGKYKLWIDPKHDYQIAQAEVERVAGNVVFPTKYTLKNPEKISVFVKNVRFEKNNGVYIPMEGNYGHNRIYPNGGAEESAVHVKVLELVLNPDHDKLGSFVPDDIENGAPVNIVDESGVVSIKYIWQDGKVIDSYGYEVNLSTLKTPSLVGKTLPSIAEFGVNLEPSVFKNNKLLICFFDYSQSPSRNSVFSLNGKTQSLLDKDIFFIFIQAEPVTEKTLAAWLTQNKIQPPVGTSKIDLHALGQRWGVQALPWLILTDKNHIVIHEGFSITELDKKIQ